MSLIWTIANPGSCCFWGLYSSERYNSKQVISKPKLAYQKNIMKTIEEEVLERDMGYPEASPEKVM